jgi:hypothetical protein
MLFGDVKRKEAAQTFKKTEFMSIKYPGQYVLRVLEAPILVVTHFVNNKYPIKCLGDNCPICEMNRKLRNENPKVTDTRQINGYSYRSEKYMLNVFDRTPVKTCPSCKTEHYAMDGQFTPICTCGTNIMNEKPHACNRVKVFSMNSDNADRIKMIEKSMQGSDGNPLGIDKYDLILLASVSNKKVTWTPMPNVNANDVVEVSTDGMTPQERFAMVLTREEILLLLKGTQIKDIFLARNATPTTPVVDSEGKELVANPDIQAKIDALFPKE